MSWHDILTAIFGAFGIAQGLWLLAIQPDPKTGAGIIKTRKGRQIAGIVEVIAGVILISLSVSSIAPGA